MTHKRWKLIFAGLVVAGAVGFLALAGVREGWVYYLPVDDFVENDQYHAGRVRLHGLVASEQFEARPGLLLAGFGLLGEHRQVRVEYRGVIPDMFQAEREVVVEGRMGDDDVFHADTLLTKCASKYESGEEGDAPHEDPRSESAS